MATLPPILKKMSRSKIRDIVGFIRGLYKASDNPEDCYIWVVDKDQDVREFGEWIHKQYEASTGHPPKAMHLVLHNVEDVKKVSKSDFKRMIKPWIDEE